MGAPSSSNINSRSVQDTYAEGRRYFEGQGALNSTLARLSKERLTVLAMLLENLGIDKAVQLGNLEDWKAAIAELESKEHS